MLDVDRYTEAREAAALALYKLDHPAYGSDDLGDVPLLDSVLTYRERAGAALDAAGVSWLLPRLREAERERDEAWRIGAAQHGYEPTDDEQAGNYMRLAKRADRAQRERDEARAQLAAAQAVLRPIDPGHDGDDPERVEFDYYRRAQQADEAWSTLSSDSSALDRVRADAWDAGRESVALDFTRPPDDAGMRAATPNPYRKEA